MINPHIEEDDPIEVEEEAEAKVEDLRTKLMAPQIGQESSFVTSTRETQIMAPTTALRGRNH